MKKSHIALIIIAVSFLTGISTYFLTKGAYSGGPASVYSINSKNQNQKAVSTKGITGTNPGDTALAVAGGEQIPGISEKQCAQLASDTGSNYFYFNFGFKGRCALFKIQKPITDDVLVSAILPKIGPKESITKAQCDKVGGTFYPAGNNPNVGICLVTPMNRSGDGISR